MRRSIGVLAWALAAAVFAISVYDVTTGLDTGGTVIATAGDMLWALLPAVFAFSSALIVARNSSNVIGWLLMIPAVAGALSVPLAHQIGAIERAPGSVSPLLFVGLFLDNYGWLLLVFPVFHLLLVFPTGRLLSRRWRWVVGLELAMAGFFAILMILVNPIGPFDERWQVTNPIGLVPLSFLNGPFLAFWLAGLVVVTGAGVGCIMLRYRRSDDVERHQMKWLFFAVAVFGVIYVYGVLNTDFTESGLEDALLALGFLGIPVSITVGVLKYRLFEIDRIISRTVGYVVVVGLLAVVYAVVAVWLPSRLTGDSPVFVAGATLAVAAMFNPLRRRVLRWVDRRFYRSRYDAERVVEEFSGRLRRQTDLDRLTDDWLGVVTETMQPSAIGVWIRE